MKEVKCLDFARRKHYQAKSMHPFFGFKSVMGLGSAEIPMHNSNVVPAHGFGNLHEIACPKGRQRREYHLKDVDNKVVLTFVMQYTNQVTA